jgi:hypothetical protein
MGDLNKTRLVARQPGGPHIRNAQAGAGIIDIA